MLMNRRTFLTSTATGLAAVALYRDPAFAASARKSRRNALVVIQLAGGNDGLSTVVPCADPQYPKLRPTIGLKSAEMLPIDARVALHGAMAKMHGLFQAGELAIVQGVGYPHPNRSHFESTVIWQTASLEPHLQIEGWIGRALPETGAFTLTGVGGGSLSPALSAKKGGATQLASLDAFAAQPSKRYPGDGPALIQALSSIYAAPAGHDATAAIARVGGTALAASDALKAAVNGYASTVVYPKGPFGDQLKLVAQLLSVDLSVRVAHVTLGGFDTHANQKRQQQTLLEQLSDGIAALLDDAAAHQFADRVAVMTYSEFGRRAAENASFGTDHGTGSVLFVAGKGVAGGLVGEPAALAKLDGGDVPFAIDFRSVYATVLRDWLDLEAAAEAAAAERGQRTLPLFR